MRHSRYSIEIDTKGAEASGYEDRLPWVCYGTIVAEGDSLDELLDDATVDLIDQDGGNPSCSPVRCDEQWMEDAIIKEFRRKYPDADAPAEPDGMALAKWAKEDGRE